eukprot:scaffold41022_cov67-Phaeocystis_antarctica.AAC.3
MIRFTFAAGLCLVHAHPEHPTPGCDCERPACFYILQKAVHTLISLAGSLTDLSNTSSTIMPRRPKVCGTVSKETGLETCSGALGPGGAVARASCVATRAQGLRLDLTCEAADDGAHFRLDHHPFEVAACRHDELLHLPRVQSVQQRGVQLDAEPLLGWNSRALFCQDGLGGVAAHVGQRRHEMEAGLKRGADKSQRRHDANFSGLHNRGGTKQQYRRAHCRRHRHLGQAAAFDTSGVHLQRCIVDGRAASREWGRCARKHERAGGESSQEEHLGGVVRVAFLSWSDQLQV